MYCVDYSWHHQSTQSATNWEWLDRFNLNLIGVFCQITIISSVHTYIGLPVKDYWQLYPHLIRFLRFCSSKHGWSYTFPLKVIEGQSSWCQTDLTWLSITDLWQPWSYMVQFLRYSSFKFERPKKIYALGFLQKQRRLKQRSRHRCSRVRCTVCPSLDRFLLSWFLDIKFQLALLENLW